MTTDTAKETPTRLSLPVLDRALLAERLREAQAQIEMALEQLEPPAEDERPELPLEPPKAEEPKRFVVTSWFLDDCFRHLTRRPEEDLFFVTGPEIDGRFILDRVVEFQLSLQAVTGAEGDPESTLRALLLMDKYGCRLGAHFHSHPGFGPEANTPSSIDWALQRSLEGGGYRAPGAIFSRDGYVRFFSHRLRFEVEALGNHIRRIGPHVFKLDTAA